MELYSRFISLTADQFIGCSRQISDQVHQELSPPFEELFDDAELYSLEILLQAWHSMGCSDKQLLQEASFRNSYKMLFHSVSFTRFMNRIFWTIFL